MSTLILNIKITLSVLLLNITCIVYAQNLTQANWKQDVNYAIKVTLNDKNNTLNGHISIQYTNNSPSNLQEIYMHLWPNAYKNNQTALSKQLIENKKFDMYDADSSDLGYINRLNFKVDDAKVDWDYAPLIDIAIIKLKEPLKTGQTILIETPFYVKIPKVFSRMGHNNQEYNITQWYPKPAVYDVNGWNEMPYLDQGEFYSEFGTFEVEITIPSDYVVAATGVLITQSEKEFRKSKTFGSKSEKYIYPNETKSIKFWQNNIHDFAWFASKSFTIFNDSVTLKSGKTIQTYVYTEVLKNEYKNGVESLKHIADAVKYYSVRVGEYPYSAVSVVKSKLKAGGGMEYPMITNCDALNQNVIVHEVGHNWFYGILGNNERRFPWMDESINSFYESNCISELDFGSVHSASIFYNLNDKILKNISIHQDIMGSNQPINYHSNDFKYLNYFSNIYGKGNYIFNHLESVLGKNVFDSCMHRYFELFKFKHPLPEDMQNVFENVSKQNLSWFFNGFINGTNFFDAKIKKLKTINGQHILNIKNKGKINAPFPVQIEYKNGTIENKILSFGTSNLGTNDIKKIIIDPKNMTTDINFANNVYIRDQIFKKSMFTFSPFKIFGNNQVRNTLILPNLAYNIYDKWMLGLQITNMSFPSKKTEYNIMPLFSFNNKTINGLATLRTILMTNTSIFENLELGIKTLSFHHLPVLKTYEYRFLRNKIYVSALIKNSYPKRYPTQKITLELNQIWNTLLEDRNTLRQLLPGYMDSIALNPNYDHKINTWFLPSTANSNYSIARLNYKIHQMYRLRPWSFEMNLEAGKDNNQTFSKIGTSFNIKLPYLKKNKGLDMRLFYGKIFGTASGLFQYSFTRKHGGYDYTFDQLMMGRESQNGLWSRQIQKTNDQMKLMGDMGNQSEAFISCNFLASLPGKIPLRPYFDVVYSNQYNIIHQSKFLYSGGIQIVVFKEVFEINLPLFQSKSISDIQTLQGYKGFGDRITLTLNLNKLAPSELIKNLKLF